MSTLTPAARVALASIKATLDALDEDDWNAVNRALGVYVRPVPLIGPGPDLTPAPVPEPVRDTTPFLAPPRPPGGP